MAEFECSECDVIENSALCNHWARSAKGLPPLCSQCDPDIGEWHNVFYRVTRAQKEDPDYDGPIGFVGGNGPLV